MGIFSKIVKKSDNKSNIIEKVNIETEKIINTLAGKDEITLSKLVDNLILFTNASGGTGVSTLVSNIAYTASQKGLNVCVIDLNILCPMQNIFFNVKNKRKEQADLVSYLLGKNNLSESIDKTNKVHILYARDRLLLDKLYCNDRTSIENLNDMFDKLREFYDVVLIDCPLNIESMLENTALYLSDIIYLVWDESIDSIVNTERMRRNLAFSGIDAYVKTKVILNKRTSINYTMHPLKELNVELVSIIPFTSEVIDSQLKSKLFCRDYATNDKTSVNFAKRVVRLTDYILSHGGYGRISTLSVDEKELTSNENVEIIKDNLEVDNEINVEQEETV